MEAEKRNRREGGFTLIEVVVAMGIVAILAGTIVPLAYRQLVRAREDATRNELSAIAAGLTEFYEDSGRFPTESEGLAALVEDPGLDSWQGPYLGGARSTDSEGIAKDEFGGAYAYDLDPKVSPSSPADVLVASKGSDYEFSSGAPGRVWNLDDPGDDLLTVVAAGPIIREKSRECRRELDALAAACRDYFEQNADFPHSISQLAGSYLDAGVDDDAFTDPWMRPYRLSVKKPAGGVPLLTIRSGGSGQGDEDEGDGEGDDEGNDEEEGEDEGGHGGGKGGGAWSGLSITISSEPPGRAATIRELEIAQSILNGKGDLHLTGRWLRDRRTLGLTDAFNTDGWGRVYGVNVMSRTIFSPGPDGRERTKNDNIPKDVGR